MKKLIVLLFVLMASLIGYMSYAFPPVPPGLATTDIDTFSELDAIVADKSLVNTSDDFTWGGEQTYTAPVLMESGTSIQASASSGVSIFDGAVTEFQVDANGVFVRPPTLPLHAASKAYADGLASPIATNNDWTGTNSFHAGVSVEGGVSNYVTNTNKFNVNYSGGSMFTVDNSGVYFDGAYVSNVPPDNLEGDVVDDQLIDPGIINITSMDIYINGAIATDNTWSGSPVTGYQAGETIGYAKLVFLKKDPNDGAGADPKVWLAACCETGSAVSAPAMGMSVESVAAGAKMAVLTFGHVYDVDFAVSMVTGSPVYLSATAGGITVTPIPTNSGETVQPVGRAMGIDKLWLQVDGVNGYYEVN